MTAATDITQTIQTANNTGEVAGDSEELVSAEIAALRQTIAEMEAQAVIPSTRSRKIPILHDEAIYKERNRIERCFNKLRQFRAVATRYDKRERIYQGTVDVASIRIWLRDPVTDPRDTP